MNENTRGPYKVDGWFFVASMTAAILSARAGDKWLPQLLGIEVSTLSQVISAIVCGIIGGVAASIALNLAASFFRRSDG